jgi:hypothetical protein
MCGFIEFSFGLMKKNEQRCLRAAAGEDFRHLVLGVMADFKPIPFLRVLLKKPLLTF